MNDSNRWLRAVAARRGRASAARLALGDAAPADIFASLVVVKATDEHPEAVGFHRASGRAGYLNRSARRHQISGRDEFGVVYTRARVAR